MVPRRPADAEARQRWRDFLRNHREVLAAMDFFTVPTATFRVLYVLFVIHHERRTVLHVRVTAHPTAGWIVQQLREAFAYDAVPRHLIFDNDRKYGTDVLAVIKHMGIRRRQITPHSPWQNGVAERWVETVRRDLLYHVIVLNERHLRRLLSEQGHSVDASPGLQAERRCRDRRPTANWWPSPSIRVAPSRLTAQHPPPRSRSQRRDSCVGTTVVASMSDPRTRPTRNPSSSLAA